MVTQADVVTKGFEAPEVGTCVIAYARTLKYPAAQNGRLTKFNYPFEFKPN